MDNGLVFVEKHAMCTGVFMDNGFVFVENLQAGWCASDTVDMCPEQLTTSEVLQTFSSTCQSHWV